MPYRLLEMKVSDWHQAAGLEAHVPAFGSHSIWESCDPPWCFLPLPDWPLCRQFLGKSLPQMVDTNNAIKITPLVHVSSSAVTNVSPIPNTRYVLYVDSYISMMCYKRHTIIEVFFSFCWGLDRELTPDQIT